MTWASTTSSKPNTPRTNLQDLLDRPYEDILAEEIIDSLPWRTVVEETQIDDPASSIKQEVKEEDVPMEEVTSSAAKKPRVSS